MAWACGNDGSGEAHEKDMASEGAPEKTKS